MKTAPRMASPGLLAAAPSPTIRIAGRTASRGTGRNAPSHLPRTIARVDTGVASTTSRPPCALSSASDVAAETLTSSSPIATWKPLVPGAVLWSTRDSAVKAVASAA